MTFAGNAFCQKTLKSISKLRSGMTGASDLRWLNTCRLILSLEVSGWITHVLDPLTSAKLQFFFSVAKVLQTFLKKYQTDKLMVPFITEDLLFIQRQSLANLSGNPLFRVQHQLRNYSQDWFDVMKIGSILPPKKKLTLGLLQRWLCKKLLRKRKRVYYKFRSFEMSALHSCKIYHTSWWKGVHSNIQLSDILFPLTQPPWQTNQNLRQTNLKAFFNNWFPTS